MEKKLKLNKEEISKLINAMEQNGEDVTVMMGDQLNIGLIENKLIYLNIINRNLNLAMELHLNNKKVNEICATFRKRQKDLPIKEYNEGDVIDSVDERVDYGTHIINANNLGVTGLHSDKKHCGLFISNTEIHQGMIFGLDKKVIEELIVTLQSQLKLLNKE
ncbi:MAG: hypothetical protein WC934_06045 [Acidithiobacillus sp.]|jgi:hypothetical protein|uniref:hypothetical protein n=1 Tax=Acidithiobacillus sp. TaxID=1872118 RepID=UPI00355DDB9A